jgi:hypothetical protein
MLFSNETDLVLGHTMSLHLTPPMLHDLHMLGLPWVRAIETYVYGLWEGLGKVAFKLLILEILQHGGF